jgi:hypothetical protein
MHAQPSVSSTAWPQVLTDAYKLLLVTLCELGFIDESDYVTFSVLALEDTAQNYYHTQVQLPYCNGQ